MSRDVIQCLFPQSGMNVVPTVFMNGVTFTKVTCLAINEAIKENNVKPQTSLGLLKERQTLRLLTSNIETPPYPFCGAGRVGSKKFKRGVFEQKNFVAKMATCFYQTQCCAHTECMSK